MSFDLLAPHYPWMENILAQGKLQRCRLHGLEAALEAKEILLLGEGHGRFLEVLGKQQCQGRITCIDSSAGMLQVAEARAMKCGMAEKQVEFIHADVLDWNLPQEKYDFIATHFFLDCFDRDGLRKVVEKLGRAGIPGCVWHIADFACPAKGWKRLRAKAILWLMYRFFRQVTKLSARKLLDPRSMIRGAGFVEFSRMESEWGLLRSTLWRKGPGRDGGRSLTAHGTSLSLD